MTGKQREVNLRFLAQPADVNFGGKPTDVPAWVPRDDGERAQQAHARRLIELSRRMEEEVSRHRPFPHAESDGP